jgi:hypothetical protein
MKYLNEAKVPKDWNKLLNDILVDLNAKVNSQIDVSELDDLTTTLKDDFEEVSTYKLKDGEWT